MLDGFLALRGPVVSEISRAVAEEVLLNAKRLFTRADEQDDKNGMRLPEEEQLAYGQGNS